MKPRLVLLAGVYQPKNSTPLTALERVRRWQKKHPEAHRASQARFRAKNPNYRREYYQRVGK